MIELLDKKRLLSAADRETILSAAAAAMAYENRSGSFSIQIGTPQQVQTLNRTFREIDRVTDVLTFPAWEGEDPIGGDGYLGDIMICHARAVEQAGEYGHSVARELAFLTVHGVLHLLGYDHATPDEERVMREKQTEILNRMGMKR